MSYGGRNEITSGRFYYTTDIYFDIIFTYNKNKIATETWYVPGTNIQVDGYINSYNKQGQLVKRDEPDYQLYTLYTYDPKGNPIKIEVYDYQGNLFYGYEFEFTTPIKNPFAAVPGLPESIFFTDAMEGPNRFTGLKQYFNDEQGNPIVFFQWNSEETEIQAGDRHLAVYQNSRDIISDTWTDQTWTYENCSGNSDAAHTSHAGKPSRENKFMKLAHAQKTATYKQDLQNFKNSFLNH
jgi:YD repeat-containing protein